MISFLSFIFWLAVSLTNGWLIMHAIGYLIKIKEKRATRILLLTSCWILSSAIIFIGDPFNILATIPCFLTAILITCEGSIWQKITVGTMFSSTILSFNAVRDNYLKPFLYTLEQYIDPTPTAYGEFIFLQKNIEFIRTLSGVVSLLFSAFLYIGIRKFAPDKDYTLSDSLWKLLLLLTVTPFGIVLTSATLSNRSSRYASHEFAPPVEHLVLLSIAMLAFISLLWCITVLARQQKLEQKNMFMEINRKYYEAMEQQHFEIRRLKHDLSNHLQVLSALPEKQRDTYLQNLTENTAVTQSLSYCKDTTINAVLTVKKNLMNRYGIRMESAIDIYAELPFDKTDICALYANALDNAVEACMKLPKNERAITLKSKAQKGLFCLEVSNPLCNLSENASPDIAAGNLRESAPVKSISIPSTSKSDKTNHGLGLKGIKEIVERYHGSLELRTVNGVFNLFLYIPLSQADNY